MMDELTTTCYRCGAQGATKYVESLNAWVHHDMRRCVSALRANAKAAEKRVAELEARLAERDAEIAALTNYPNSEYGHVNY